MIKLPKFCKLKHKLIDGNKSIIFKLLKHYFIDYKVWFTLNFTDASWTQLRTWRSNVYLSGIFKANLKASCAVCDAFSAASYKSFVVENILVI